MFTRNVSSALDELITWGKSVGVDVNMLAEMSVDDLMTIESEGSFDACLWLEDRYPRVQETRNQLNAAELPSLIFESEDFEIFRFLNTEPNYIGRKACVGLALKLEECDETEDFSDKIIFIPQADPGYDWLFGRNIKGLVTMYGGVNSHMAIRASEFGVTAAIGVGVSRYRSLVRNTEIEINPIEKLIRIFR